MQEGLEKLGYEWEITDLSSPKPALRVWKPKEEKDEGELVSVRRIAGLNFQRTGN